MTPVRDVASISKVKDYGLMLEEAGADSELTLRLPSGSGDKQAAEAAVKKEAAAATTPEKKKTDAAPTSARRQRSDSVTTFHGGGAESIFRLLPRETRPALRRMLFVEPSARCTLTDLLKGKGKVSGLLCGCHGHEGATSNGVDAPPGGHCEDHDCDPEEEDDGDEWLKSIVPCSSGVPPQHVHIKVAVDHKHKRRFF